ncbi:hypothetical protein ACFC0D_06980 [Streptomyces sp. NPDC056222]|uniref:hypothetical protein n=1 Tax=Streptomyces sp. NPDC056222 TaxID=3345749 RepID=UPI0035DF15CA
MELTAGTDAARTVRLPRSLPLTSRRHIDLLRVCSAASRVPLGRTGTAVPTAL